MSHRQNPIQKTPAKSAVVLTSPTSSNSLPLRSALQRAQTTPDRLRAEEVRQLQSSVGNQAVAHLLHRGGDPSTAPVIQPKLRVGAVNDPYEREADAVVSRLFGGGAQDKQGSSAPSLTGSQVQRRASMGKEGGPLQGNLERQIQQTQSGGSALPQGVRRQLEPKLGADLAAVKVHTDAHAVQLTRALGAEAFTHQNHIYYGEGKSPHDLRLTAHEAVHTIQQGAVAQPPAQVQRAPGEQQPGQAGMIQRKGEKGESIADLENGLVPNFTPNPGTPAGYSVTVAVATGMENYITFAKTRMKSTIRNKLRGFVRGIPGLGGSVRNPKSSKEIKDKAARRVLEERGETPDDSKVKKVLDQADSVGHAWIKFNAQDAQGNLLKTYSFGFMYGASPTHPAQKVAGLVKQPDMMFEDKDESTRFLTTNVSAKSYAQGLKRAKQIQANPPQYSTMDYNCTKFVREVAKAAGATYPGGTGMMIPVSNFGEIKLFSKAYNPTLLHEKLGKQTDAVDNDSPEMRMMENDNLMESSDGMLGRAEDIMSSKDIRKLIYQYQYVMDEEDRASMEKRGLSAELLKKLTKEDIQELHEDEIAIAQMFQTFGLSTEGLPGTRGYRGGRYGGYGGYGGYGNRYGY